MTGANLTHFDAAGQAHMVDVSGKAATSREAVAEGAVVMTRATLALAQGGAAKGDVLGVARLAGIMGAKQTAALIPLCHPLPIDKVALDLAADEALPGIRIRATVRTSGRTGVEMEALTAVTVAALTVYDMLKAAEKGMRIEGIRLLAKAGGKSGDWRADAGDAGLALKARDQGWAGEGELGEGGVDEDGVDEGGVDEGGAVGDAADTGGPNAEPSRRGPRP